MLFVGGIMRAVEVAADVRFCAAETIQLWFMDEARVSDRRRSRRAPNAPATTYPLTVRS